MSWPPSRIGILCKLPLMFFLAAAPNTIAIQKSSPRAAPIGTPANLTITTGDAYTSLVERHAARLTVLEVVRGPRAWNLVKRASASNPMARNGYEYLLARVRFEFEPERRSANNSYLMRENRFIALSQDGVEYDPVSIEYPKPACSGKVYSGDSLTGWVTFLVAQEDEKPVLVFNRSFRLRLY